jgi:hypothetical protein
MQYLLDTSVIRGTPGALLAKAATHGHRLLVSPISVWELLTHFDEGGKDFKRCSGWLRKLEHCDILDHPDAEIREALGVAEYIQENDRIAWREREGAVMIVKIFASAKSPTDIQRARFFDSSGNLHTAEGCGRRAKAALSQMEDQYTKFMSRLLGEYNAEFSRRERKRGILTDDEFFELVKREVLRIASTADTPIIEAPEERIFELVFARIGHALETLLYCLATNAVPRGNDYEDALLCQHIDIATDRVLVTNDAKVRAALTQAHERLIRHAAAHKVYARPTPVAIEPKTFEEFVMHKLTT